MTQKGVHCNYPSSFSSLFRIYSLASHAVHVRCSRLLLTGNVFVEMQDASLDVEFGFGDVQNNTFLTLNGRPFENLRPAQKEEVSLYVLSIMMMMMMTMMMFAVNRLAET